MAAGELSQHLNYGEAVWGLDPYSETLLRSGLIAALSALDKDALMATMCFRCPQCKKKDGVNISYGYPSNELFEEVERNEAVLGGCMQEFGAPDRQCLGC